MSTIVRIILFFLFFIAMTAEAQIYQCVGIDDAGKSVYVIVDFFTNRCNVNGHMFNIVSRNIGNNVVTTENFTITINLLVYDSFTLINNRFYLTLVNAYTNQPILAASLTC
jgi:hypothetical protein